MISSKSRLKLLPRWSLVKVGAGGPVRTLKVMLFCRLVEMSEVVLLAGEGGLGGAEGAEGPVATLLVGLEAVFAKPFRTEVESLAVCRLVLEWSSEAGLSGLLGLSGADRVQVLIISSFLSSIFLIQLLIASISFLTISSTWELSSTTLTQASWFKGDHTSSSVAG